MNRIYLLIYTKHGKYQFFKYFNTVQEKDDYKRKIKYVKDLLIIEDSSDIVYRWYMIRRYIINKKEEKKLLDDIKVKCNYCGHVICIGRSERIICSHCGRYVYKNKKIALKYEVEKLMKH